MAIPARLLHPGAVVALTRSLTIGAVESAAALATVPVRVFGMLGAAELLTTRVTMLVDQAEGLLTRTAQVVEDAENAVRQVEVASAAAALAVQEAGRVAAAAATVVAEAELVAGAASGLVSRTTDTAATAEELLSTFEPTLRRAAPMAERFVAQLSQEEVTAAIRLVDELPKLREHLTDNVLPLLGTLDKVGPDLHDLLEVTRDLKLAVAGIPGLKMLRRRGEDRLTDEGDDG